MKDSINFIVGIAFMLLLFYGAWQVKRWWNYSWGYSSHVQTEVCEMVKTEHLTDKGKKICN